MAWMEANGVTLEYFLDGPEGGKPLVLTHELGGSAYSWDAVMPALIEAGYRVLRWHWRGTGMSEKIKGDLAVETVCADLAALLDALAFPKPADMAGTALGGGVVLVFAALYPDKVNRLLVSSPAIGGGDGLEQMLRTRADEVEQNGMRPLVEQSLVRSYKEQYRTDPAAYTAYRNRWIANDPASYASHNRMLAAMDETPKLAKVSCPTLVIGGSEDELLTPAMMQPIAEAIPNAEYRELATGHFFPVNTPKLWVDVALPWFDG